MTRHKPKPAAYSNCQYCGKPLTASAHHLGRKYCNNACFGAANGRNKKGKPTGQIPHNRVYRDRPLRPEEISARRRAKVKADRLKLPKIECACGCGELIPVLTSQGLPARYKNHHQPHGTPPPMGGWNKGKPAPWARKTHLGRKQSPEQAAKRKATILSKNGGKFYSFKQTQDSIKRISDAQRGIKRPQTSGPLNPFFGKKHSEESRKKMSEKLKGPNHPRWRGNIHTLPYGLEFTKPLKRKIRDRDNHTCQRCGAKEEGRYRALDVHHIDHNRRNNDPDNLTTVCQKCNTWCSLHRDQPLVPVNRR